MEEFKESSMFSANGFYVTLDDGARAPLQANDGDAGYDLFSIDEDFTIPAGKQLMISTGICVRIPKGTYGRVAPRSGLAYKNQINVHAGVIDESYRGKVHVILMNHSDKDFHVAPHTRIAQLIITRIATPKLQIVSTLDETTRGNGGFGSTGLH